MNALLQARTAYGVAEDATRTPRDAEYQAFARATRALTAAARSGKTAPGQLADALTLNRRLWTVLAADLAIEGNALPEGLRVGLLGLAQFVLNHSDTVLNGGGDVAPLVDVNTAIMRGLRGQDAQ